MLSFEANDAVDERVAKAISAACDETMKRLKAPDSEIQNIDRINEVSSHFEDTLRQLLNATPGLQCDFPFTTKEKLQRSDYPDLRITDLESKRVFYLDPKLYAAGSRDSSFRTFYFEPKKSTNKFRDDAVHFVVGFEHAPRETASGSSERGVEIHAIGPCRSFAVYRQTEGRISAEQPGYVSAGGNCRVQRKVTCWLVTLFMAEI